MLLKTTKRPRYNQILCYKMRFDKAEDDREKGSFMM